MSGSKQITMSGSKQTNPAAKRGIDAFIGAKGKNGDAKNMTGQDGARISIAWDER